MLNIIDSNNVSFIPMNYYLTFAASDTDAEVEIALRISRAQLGKIADIILLANAADFKIDMPMEISAEITRTQDAGDGVNSLSENLGSKVVWFGMDGVSVTLFVAGYQHAVRVPIALFQDKCIELYAAMSGEPWKMVTRPSSAPGNTLGSLTVFEAGCHTVVRQRDMMYVATFGNNGMRKNSQPLTFYVQDVDGLWLRAEHVSSARYAHFVSQTSTIGY